MDWEQTKENCVPVRAGRPTAALQELTQADSAAADSSSGKYVLEERRKELWREVTDYAGDDPLEAWQRCADGMMPPQC